MASLSRFLYRNLFLSLASVFASVSLYLSPLFNFITTFVLRLRRCKAPLKKNSGIKEEYQKESVFPETEQQLDSEDDDFKDVSEFPDSDNNEETQETEFCLTFKFPTYEEFCKSKEDKGEFGISQETEAVKTEDLKETKVVKTEDLKETEDLNEVHSKSEVFNEEEKGIDSYSDGFLTDEGFGGEFELDDALKDIEMSEDQNQESDDNMDKLFDENVESRNEDANKLETLWEHQELIEQLKMELRKVRDTGLPTILEESDTAKMEDLQPWKIDGKFQSEDCMSELHKFYKSYRERMRKFDILTYQKMHAIGYPQKDTLKDPFQQVSSQRSSGPKLKSLISQNIRLFKHKMHDNIDPVVQFIKELQSDLEVIYVGQMCLSWEFLHWQYGKALSLWDSDPHGTRTYNEVAGEFQQFQVLLQRFVENEPFQGSRVQYYIKGRYDLRNLLQVPVIREERIKDKNKASGREKDEYYITSDMLVKILEESIRIFWQFVRADRGCSRVMVKSQKGIHQELKAQGDLDLLMEVKRSLEKKEKKLKDALRGECCILKRFKKYKEDDDSDHTLIESLALTLFLS
ncbi:hypothetical protein RND71_034121 [Anisodus tanguticus]|uniref:Ribosomal protein L34Ae n=1 Tax=Anisodus tanguticus TaxID=243964 RepID=A0AAE1UY37_9SOLA|nr:hypothetical protein RND71_034121 [Anisodus tanguticus]